MSVLNQASDGLYTVLIVLVRAIVRPDNTLTARVMVNRIWQWHFGTGIVDTANDFGINGGRPTHPELLDWLASEFESHGWSVKHIHRLIVSSSAGNASVPSSRPSMWSSSTKTGVGRMRRSFMDRRSGTQRSWSASSATIAATRGPVSRISGMAAARTRRRSPAR